MRSEVTQGEGLSEKVERRLEGVGVSFGPGKGWRWQRGEKRSSRVFQKPRGTTMHSCIPPVYRGVPSSSHWVRHRTDAQKICELRITLKQNLSRHITQRAGKCSKKEEKSKQPGNNAAEVSNGDD